MSYQAQITSLKVDKALLVILFKYIDFADDFCPDLIAKLLKHIGINNYTIKLVDSKQFLYGLIYHLRPMGLETLKTYIEINLVNSFVRPYKSPAGAPILFDHEPDNSFHLYVNYRSRNNLIIKN